MVPLSIKLRVVAVEDGEGVGERLEIPVRIDEHDDEPCVEECD